MNIQKAVWVLNQISGFGIQKFKHLCEEVKDLPALFQPEILTRLSKIPEFGCGFADQVQAVSDSGEFEKELERTEREGIQIIPLADPAYPKNLSSIYDPPLILYVKGTLIPEDDVSIAIVGSRHATSYGFRIAGRFAEELAACGVTIVSGFARGIDGEAHRGAIRAKGRTIAVLGCGLDIIYPKEHQGLHQDIVSSGGALISEFPLGMPPLALNFPKRNRVISGLSMGVLVVEASKRSGSLITARLAAEEGREVYAIPGPIDSITSRGVNELIQQGARLVISSDNILEDLAPQLRASLDSFSKPTEQVLTPSANVGAPFMAPDGCGLRGRDTAEQYCGKAARKSRPYIKNSSSCPPLKEEVQDPILNLLKRGPLSFDEIAVGLGQESGLVRSRMIELELKGSVKRIFGGSYAQNSHMTKLLK